MNHSNVDKIVEFFKGCLEINLCKLTLDPLVSRRDGGGEEFQVVITNYQDKYEEPNGRSVIN